MEHQRGDDAAAEPRRQVLQLHMAEQGPHGRRRRRRLNDARGPLGAHRRRRRRRQRAGRGRGLPLPAATNGVAREQPSRRFRSRVRAGGGVSGGAGAAARAEGGCG